MESNNNSSADEQNFQGNKELLEATTQIYNHIFSFIKSMTVKCAVELGIPDAIHNHNGTKPMTLSDLSQALPNIHPQKARFLPRIMRMLAHMGYLKVDQNNNDDDDDGNSEGEIGYTLTAAGKLLLKDHPFSSFTMWLFLLDSSGYVEPWMDLSRWFQQHEEPHHDHDPTTTDLDDDDQVVVPSPFQTCNGGMLLWEYANRNPEFNKTLNDAMAFDSRVVTSVLIGSSKDTLEGVLNGVRSLIDVGGGSGVMARAIANAFPNIKCSVFDLPHVVDGLKGNTTRDNLTYIAGDIPPTDAILLKWIVHDWDDQHAVKILKQCRKAITKDNDKINNEHGRSGSGSGKVIIIDAVLMGDHEPENDDDTEVMKARDLEVQLYFDLEMMVVPGGKERTEKGWKKLFQDAGFGGGYTIYPVLGFRSLIEVYP